MPRFDTTDAPIAHDNYERASSRSDDVRVDSSVVGYDPNVPGHWEDEVDPGHVDASLDQLAERVHDNEDALGSLTNDHGGLQGLADDDHPQYLLANGMRELAGDWDAGSHEIRARTLQADIPTGTAPLSVSSTTLVPNLNADKLDGNDASYFAAASHTHAAADIDSGVLADSRVGAKHRMLAHQWYLEDPEVGDAYVLCKVPVASTIKRVNHTAIGAGSSADFNVEIRDEGEPESGGTLVWSTDKTVTAIHAIETTFDNAAIGQYQVLVITIEALGATAPDRIWIGLVLEYDSG